jgi:hypothetical protein
MRQVRKSALVRAAISAFIHACAITSIFLPDGPTTTNDGMNGANRVVPWEMFRPNADRRWQMIQGAARTLPGAGLDPSPCLGNKLVEASLHVARETGQRHVRPRVIHREERECQYRHNLE